MDTEIVILMEAAIQHKPGWNHVQPHCKTTARPLQDHCKTIAIPLHVQAQATQTNRQHRSSNGPVYTSGHAQAAARQPQMSLAAFKWALTNSRANHTLVDLS